MTNLSEKFRIAACFIPTVAAFGFNAYIQPEGSVPPVFLASAAMSGGFYLLVLGLGLILHSIERRPAPFKLIEIFNEVAQNSKSQPNVYLSMEPVDNAYAANNSVTITNKLYHALDEKKLKFVLGHEIAHVENKDSLKMLFAYLPTQLTCWAQFICFFNSTLQETAIYAASTMCSLLLLSHHSRMREYECDDRAAELSGETADGIAALSYLESKRIGNASSGDLFSTHPCTFSRIDRLKRKLDPS